MLTGVWFDERREGERDNQNSPVLDAKPRSWQVELLPGVMVTYAADGVINLGVPIGRPQYVQWQLERQLREQAECMRLIVEYAADESKATHHQGHCLARGIALQLLRYCSNARDVHFLRALPADVVRAAAGQHDAGVLQAIAGVLGQVSLTEFGPPEIGAPLGVDCDVSQA